MKHQIKIDKYTRESDGKALVRITLSELAGADGFLLFCDSPELNDALREMAIRLQLGAEDAENIAKQLLDHLKQEEQGEESSPEDKKEESTLKLIRD